MSEQTSSSQGVLEVSGLSKSYRVRKGLRVERVPVLHDVSFRLARGEIVALVGESGSGKSTVARILARLVAPSGGTIRLDGADVRAGARAATLDYRRRVQMVFQDPYGSLNPAHTVEHHLRRPLVVHGRGAGREAARIHELLAAVGLTPPDVMAARRPHELSGGQRQRVAIARALAVEPQVLIADEPTSMLDVSLRVDVLNLLGRLRDEQRLAVLFITHDLASARYLADRVLVLHGGKVVEEGPVESVVASPAHPYTRRLLAAAPDPGRGRPAQAQSSTAAQEVVS
jgi:peptide/nickel transport system ATP-binding protein